MTLDATSTARIASPYAALHLREGAPRELVEETYWLLVSKLRFGVTSEFDELRRLDELNRAYEAIARNGHSTQASSRAVAPLRKRWYGGRTKPAQWKLDPFETLFVMPDADGEITGLAQRILAAHPPSGMTADMWVETLADAASKVSDPAWRARHEKAAAEDAWAATRRALEEQAEAQRLLQAESEKVARHAAEEEAKRQREAEDLAAAEARRAMDAREKARRAAEAAALRAAEAEVKAQRAAEAEASRLAEVAARAEAERVAAARAEAERVAAADAEARRVAQETLARDAAAREEEAGASGEPDLVRKWVEMGVAQVEPASGKQATGRGQDVPRDGSGDRVAGGLWGMLEQVLARGERQREIVERENERVLTLRDGMPAESARDDDENVAAAPEPVAARDNGHHEVARPPAFLLIGDEAPAPLDLSGDDARQFTLGDGPNAAKVQLWRRGDSYMLQQISGAPISIGGQRLTAPIVVLEDGDEIAHDGSVMRIVLGARSENDA